MALNAQIQVGIEGKIWFEIGAVQLVTAEARHGLARTRVDDVRPDRMRRLMRLLVALQTEAHLIGDKIVGLRRSVRLVTIGAVHFIMGEDLFRRFTGVFIFLKMALDADRRLRPGQKRRLR